MAIPCCRSLSLSLADTLFELSIVVNPRVSVGMSIMSLIVSEKYKHFRFRQPFPVVGHY